MMLYAPLFAAAALLLVENVSASCSHGTSLHRRQEQNGKVKVSEFGYTNLQGPLNWVALSAENTACKESDVQSPINLDSNTQLAVPGSVQMNIPPVERAPFENLGTTTEVIVNGTTTIDGQQFNLKQFHLHTPSEHRINEEYFPMEMHMVHESAANPGVIAVMAVLFQLSEDGSTTELLTKATENIQKIQTPGTITETGALNFDQVITHLTTTPLFKYTGSLTTPPCAEGLTFLVTQQTLPVNVATYNAVKSVIKFNSRYTQNTPGATNLLKVSAAATPGSPPPPQAGEGQSEAGQGSPLTCTCTIAPGQNAGSGTVGTTTTTALQGAATTATVVEGVGNSTSSATATVVEGVGNSTSSTTTAAEAAATSVGAAKLECIMGSCKTVPKEKAKRFKKLRA